MPPAAVLARILRAKPQIRHRYLLTTHRGLSTMFSIARPRAKQMNKVPGARVGVTVKSRHEGPPPRDGTFCILISSTPTSWLGYCAVVLPRRD